MPLAVWKDLWELIRSWWCTDRIRASNQFEHLLSLSHGSLVVYRDELYSVTRVRDIDGGENCGARVVQFSHFEGQHARPLEIALIVGTNPGTTYNRHYLFAYLSRYGEIDWDFLVSQYNSLPCAGTGEGPLASIEPLLEEDILILPSRVRDASFDFND